VEADTEIEERGKRKEERGKRKEERGKRKEERGKRKEERGKRKEERGKDFQFSGNSPSNFLNPDYIDWHIWSHHQCFVLRNLSPGKKRLL
jgi:hypothetical protein